MGKSKKKGGRGDKERPELTPDAPLPCEQAPSGPGESEPAAGGLPASVSTGAEEAAAAEKPPFQTPAAKGRAPVPPGRLRRWLPDVAKVVLACAVVGVAAAIWYKPPLVRADYPYLSYVFKGQRATDAVLYRPLAMPTRYYIALPQKLAGRYQWFAVDRRREVAAMTTEPSHRFFGKPAIKRSDPLGLDLEFRKLDGSEWRIGFFDNAIVFSNALLTVRLDTQPAGDR